jgi:arylsulfatase A-like enzyme
LAEILRANGLATAGLVSNPFLTESFGATRGFESYMNGFARIPEQAYTQAVPKYRDGRKTTDKALAWLDDQGLADFFLVVHYFDAHAPLRPPAPFRGRFTTGYDGLLGYPLTGRRVEEMAGRLNEADLGFLRGAYDEEISFLDSEIGRLLDGLNKRDLFDRTLVFFTSDHGEELLERGIFDHGHSFYNELLRIPLAMWGPGVVASRNQAMVSLLDVMPTALDALGISIPAGLQGESLWTLARGTGSLPKRVLFAEATTNSRERAVIGPRHKAIVPDDGGPIRVYDWIINPSESTDLMSAREESGAHAFGRQARALLPTPELASSSEAVEMPPEVQESLRALGYID